MTLAEYHSTLRVTSAGTREVECAVIYTTAAGIYSIWEGPTLVLTDAMIGTLYAEGEAVAPTLEGTAAFVIYRPGVGNVGPLLAFWTAAAAAQSRAEFAKLDAILYPQGYRQALLRLMGSAGKREVGE